MLCLALGDLDRDLLEGLGGLFTHELLLHPDMIGAREKRKLGYLVTLGQEPKNRMPEDAVISVRSRPKAPTH